MNLPLPRLHRPRVEGDRQREILDAAIEVLSEVGYDRFTMDAVSSRAKVSKATLYRHWEGKVDLVVDALSNLKDEGDELPDTGTLRGDLLTVMCGHGGLDDQRSTSLFAGVLTAISRDPEFASAFRERFIAPKVERSDACWRRAADRGELREGLDLDLMSPACAGIVLHRTFLLGEAPTVDVITKVIDQIILPAALKPSVLKRELAFAHPSATKEKK
ncbi:TetR/AcrR family transcriptional regulator [Nocardioides sp. Kera G14]|uniref:TetR/AcrR family transcriptional regulator n=1 Tax=Nocardioides sp. Kera G14 TaxID=2884264 RepID=UPI001D11F7D7|nr:TetR/AcrR family transcriptional regulator [Nocardioides sp. Kera G14]UDY24520.1 TetR/AcrR family transcriptional regulator [Nocardioides sp. Kera G14]